MPLVLCACTDSELADVDASANDDSGLLIDFSLANYTVNSSTRATSSEDMEAYSEPWSDSTWGETTLNRLDLFVFRPTTTDNVTTYNLVYHFYNASPSTETTWKLTYTNDYSETTNYASSCIQDTDSLYLIANYAFTVVDKNLAENITNDPITTLTVLKNLTVGYIDNQETPHGPRKNFFYSAHLKGSDYTAGNTSTQRTYSFKLQRFMAKACIRIYYREYEKTSYTQLTDFSDEDITLQAMQFTVKGPVTDDGVAPLSYSSTTSTITDSDGETHTTATYTYTYNIDVFSDPSAPTSETYYNDESSGYCAVFYFYPNDWLDMNLVPYMYSGQPVISTRRTYIQMNVKFSYNTNSSATYQYEVPLNYLLPTDSDSKVYTYPEEMTDDSYKDLYRIYANHVYNVNVYIAEQETGFKVYVSTDSSGNADFVEDLTEDSDYIILEEENIIVETDGDSPVEDLEEDDDYIITIVGVDDEDDTTSTDSTGSE